MTRLTVEAKVGLLVLVAGAALWWSVGRIEGFSREEMTRYETSLEDAAGLAPGGKVEIAGVVVGEIESIEERDGRALVKFRVKKGRTLPAGTTIVAETENMLGDRKLRLVPGRGAGETPLAPGSEVPATPSAAELGEVIARVDLIARDLEAITGSVRGVVADEEGEARLERMMADLAVFSANLARASSHNAESIDKIVANLVVLTDRVNRIAESSGAKLDSTLASVDSVAAKIDGGKGTIGRLVNDETTIDSINEAVEGVNEVLEPLQRTRVYVSYQGEAGLARADGSAGSIKNALSVRIQPQEHYGYLVGVSDDADGFRARKKTVTILDPDGSGPAPGAESVMLTEKTTNDYRLTAQVFRRFGPVSGRIGLKEGTGGVGADVFLFRDRFRVSADAWQFAREKKGEFGATMTENPRLRLSGRYDVYDHLFVTGGADDIASRYGRRTYFLGAGFEFNDDDLKYLLGTLPMP